MMETPGDWKKNISTSQYRWSCQSDDAFKVPAVAVLQKVLVPEEVSSNFEYDAEKYERRKYLHKENGTFVECLQRPQNIF